MNLKSPHPRRILLACATAFLLSGLVPPFVGADGDGEVVLVPRGSAWSYRVDAYGACPGFESLLYVGPCAFTEGLAPFGNGDPTCDHLGLAPPLTAWPEDTELLASVIVVAPLGTTSPHFDYDVDNDLGVYLDGAPAFSAAHGFCGLHGSFDVVAGPGVHKISVRASDYGALSYFDMNVTARQDASGLEVVSPAIATVSPWSYRVDGHGACAGFETVDYAGPCEFGIGLSPFGNADLTCAALPLVPPLTPWEAETDLLASSTILVDTSASRWRFAYVVDNDIEVFIDGVLVKSGSYGNCALRDSFEATLAPGLHKVAVRARDHGALSYFSMDATPIV